MRSWCVWSCQSQWPVQAVWMNAKWLLLMMPESWTVSFPKQTSPWDGLSSSHPAALLRRWPESPFLNCPRTSDLLRTLDRFQKVTVSPGHGGVCVLGGGGTVGGVKSILFSLRDLSDSTGTQDRWLCSFQCDDLSICKWVWHIVGTS